MAYHSGSAIVGLSGHPKEKAGLYRKQVPDS